MVVTVNGWKGNFEICLVVIKQRLWYSWIIQLSSSVQVSEYDEGFYAKPWINGRNMTNDIAKSEKRILSWKAGYKKHLR